MAEVAAHEQERVAGGGGGRVRQAVAEVERGFVPAPAVPRERVGGRCHSCSPNGTIVTPKLRHELLNRAPWRAPLAARENQTGLDECGRADPHMLGRKDVINEIQVTRLGEEDRDISLPVGAVAVDPIETVRSGQSLRRSSSYLVPSSLRAFVPSCPRYGTANTTIESVATMATY